MSDTKLMKVMKALVNSAEILDLDDDMIHDILINNMGKEYLALHYIVKPQVGDLCKFLLDICKTLKLPYNNIRYIVSYAGYGCGLSDIIGLDNGETEKFHHIHLHHALCSLIDQAPFFTHNKRGYTWLQDGGLLGEVREDEDGRMVIYVYTRNGFLDVNGETDSTAINKWLSEIDE